MLIFFILFRGARRDLSIKDIFLRRMFLWPFVFQAMIAPVEYDAFVLLV